MHTPAYISINQDKSSLTAIITTDSLSSSYPITREIALMARQTPGIGEFLADPLPESSQKAPFSFSMNYLDQLAYAENAQHGYKKYFIFNDHRVLSYAANKSVLNLGQDINAYFIFSHFKEAGLANLGNMQHGLVGYYFESESKEELSAVKKIILSSAMKNKQSLVASKEDLSNKMMQMLWDFQIAVFDQSTGLPNGKPVMPC